MTPQSKNVFFLFFTGFTALLLFCATVNLSLHTGTPAAANDGDVGYQLMRKYGCFTCHKFGGVGSTVGPRLDGVGSRREAEWLARWIKNPYTIKGNARMPAFGYLSEEHIGLIADYLSQQQQEPR